MIAFANPDRIEPSESTWRTAFAALLPKIESKLRYEFRHLNAEAQQESVQEGTVNCLVAYRRLVLQGRGTRATARSLARFAARQMRAGRTSTTKLNGRDPLSRYAQLRHGIRIQQLGPGEQTGFNWIEELVEDRRARVPDQVALRVDMPQWLAQFPRRKQAIARDLGLGWSTAEVARRHRVSPGRISQLRREFKQSWERLQTKPN